MKKSPPIHMHKPNFFIIFFLLISEPVGDKFRRLAPFQFKDRAAMRLAGGIRLLLDHGGQKIQGRVPVFIQQDGMEPEHILRMEGDDSVFLQHRDPSCRGFLER